MTLTFALDPLSLVRVAALVFGVLTLGAVLDLTVGTFRRNRAHRRRHAQVRRAFDHVVSLTDPAADATAVADELGALPGPVVEEALTITARSLAGRDRDRFREVADAIGMHDRAGAQLRSRRWWRRLRAVRVLRLTSAQAPVLALFDDEEAEIRAAAALWVGSLLESGEPFPATDERSDPDAASVTAAAGRLADGLLDPAALVRLATKHAVARGGPVPVDAVARALTRCLTVPDRPPLWPLAPLAAAAVLGTDVDPELVTPFLDDRDPRVRAAAIRADAAVRPERIAELCERFVDDEPVVREAVAAVADRDLTVVRHLVGLSADEAWQVRQVARERLGRLGPVGRALPACATGGGRHVIETFLRTALVSTAVVAFGYFLVVNGTYSLQLWLAALELRERRRRVALSPFDWWHRTPDAPRLSVLAPAYDEEVTIVDAVEGMLTLEYPDLEVVVINDGSRDGTLEVLREAFDLAPDPHAPADHGALEHRPIRQIHRSRLHPGLIVPRAATSTAPSARTSSSWCVCAGSATSSAPA